MFEDTEVRGPPGRLIEIRHQSNTDTVVPYIQALASIRLGLASPSAVELAIPDASGIAEAFDRYRAALAEAGAVDFDEQIYLAIETLLTDPNIRSTVGAKCRHLLVDEFQDLNPAHLLLIRLLAPRRTTASVSATTTRSSTATRGRPPSTSSTTPLLPRGRHHALTVNYRCPPAIVGAARHLLSYNARRVEKEIVTAPDRSDDVTELPAPLAGAGPLAVLRAPAEALAALAIDTISAWRDSGVALDDMAVLARVNSALLPVQVACIEAQTPAPPRFGHRAEAHRDPHGLRVPADRGGPRPDPKPGHSRNHPPSVPEHRPQRGPDAGQGRPRSPTSAGWPGASRAATARSWRRTPTTSSSWPPPAPDIGCRPAGRPPRHRAGRDDGRARRLPA